jgi:asparagine synthase (glutamine-hydrolysing)
VDLKTLSIQEASYQSAPIGNGRYSNVEEALEAVRSAVITAVKRNMVADAPLGVFLSGGIDSSLLTILAAKEIGESVVTVSVNFDEATFDEKPYQDIVLKRIQGKQHHSFKVNEEMLWSNIESIWHSMDQPTIDGINSWFVSMAAHQAGLKAVMSGLGADELFGGYASSRRTRWVKMLRMMPAKELAATLTGSVKSQYKRINYLKLNSRAGDALFLRGLHTVNSIATILDCDESEVWNTLSEACLPESTELKFATDATRLEYDFYMKGQLLKDTDFMSMRFALEARVPFLDQDLIGVACKALNTSSVNSQPKYFLTKAFEDVLPQEIIFREKRGFTFPFHVWLAKRVRNNNGLLSDRLSNILPMNDFLSGRSHWSQVWSGVVLEQFKMSR